LRIAIVGAGLAGLTAARSLARRGHAVTVYEASLQIGGLAASHSDSEGFTYDTGAHFITNRLAAAIGIASECRDVARYGESVYLRGRAFGYPLGLIREGRYVVAALRARIFSSNRRAPSRDAAEEFERRYGDALAHDIALPLIEAWSGIPAQRLSAAVARMIPPTLKSIYLALASRVTGRVVACGYSYYMPEKPSVWHVYPKDGLATLCRKLMDDFAGDTLLQSPVEAIHVEDGAVRAVTVNGERREVDAVVSTLPRHVLARIVTGTDALEPLRQFRYRPMTFVTLRLTGRDLLPDVVTWTPEARFPFFRLTEVPSAMPWLAPEGKTSITADLGCEVGDEIWTASDAALTERVLSGLTEIVPDAASRFLGSHVARTAVAYPVYDLAYEDQRVRFAHSLGIDGLISVGRNGEFAHLFMEDVYWRTLEAIEPLMAAA
jgi:oxygen-dependent protoporphyrinogen oxidase